jgi:hypothetical protein
MAGRPKGLPKTGGRQKGSLNRVTADVKALAQNHGGEAIAMLATILTTSENDSARIAAAKELLDRGYGKSMQAVELSGADGGPIDHSVTVEFVKP